MKQLILALSVALIALLPISSNATVQPPEEWLNTPERIAEWEAFQPTLLDWEFEEQPVLFGKPLDRAQGIEQFIEAHLHGSHNILFPGLVGSHPVIEQFHRYHNGRGLLFGNRFYPAPGPVHTANK